MGNFKLCFILKTWPLIVSEFFNNHIVEELWIYFVLFYFLISQLSQHPGHCLTKYNSQKFFISFVLVYRDFTTVGHSSLNPRHKFLNQFPWLLLHSVRESLSMTLKWTFRPQSAKIMPPHNITHRSLRRLDLTRMPGPRSCCGSSERSKRSASVAQSVD